MQIIISLMVVGLLWMIYDLINAPEVDGDENPIFPEDLDDDGADDEIPSPGRKEKKETSKIED